MDHHHEKQVASVLRHQTKPLVDKAVLHWESSKSGLYFSVHDDPKLECHMMRDIHTLVAVLGTSFGSVPPVQKRYSRELEHSLADTPVSPGVIEDAGVSLRNWAHYLDGLEVEVVVRAQGAMVATIAPVEQGSYIH